MIVAVRRVCRGPVTGCGWLAMTLRRATGDRVVEAVSAWPDRLAGGGGGVWWRALGSWS
jgi:hypothetical protein